MAMESSVSFHSQNSGMQIGINYGTTNTYFGPQADPLDKLPIAYGAEFDSYADQHEDFCLPGTRTELLSQILAWAESPDGKCIFWLNGMAGTGKSTIARTVARCFEEKERLGATFFFKRGEADRNQPATVVVIIDALDECDQENDIQIILRLLFNLQKVTSFCLRIFLTSRPELPIRLGFRQSNNHQDLVLHKLPKPVIEHDIRLFLEHKLSKIRDDHLLPLEWPENENTEKLVKMAVPLFIFAATICRFIGDIDWLPEERLAAVLQDEAATSTSDIERTYLPVLNQLIKSKNERDSEQLIKEFQNIIGVIILLATPLSVVVLSQLTGIPQRNISNRLNRFHSVLNIPEEPHQPVRILHLSFRDFLINTTSIFYVDEKETHQKIFLHCLRVMNAALKQNICGLSSYGTQRTDISDNQVNKHISTDLQYSCRYWIYHFEHSHGHITNPVAFNFMKKHFLHWLEVLSLMGIISQAVAMMDILQSGAKDPKYSDFLYDAKRFILKNTYIASLAPLQLYSSGLVFSPMQSTIRKMFFDSSPKQISILPQVEDYWSPGLQTLEGHSASVMSVAFSSDGQTVVSGSVDRTIKLWDTKTGSELQTLKGHSASVTSVAFSSDGQTVASGSWDSTIKLWDTKAGSELQILKGHSAWVSSVAFSSNGQTVASGSNDGTIKLWDTRTGSKLQTLKAHSALVTSVAFSSDGQAVASGSWDRTIKFWDTKTGSELQTLKAHSALVTSVAFSSDGQAVASGSWDRTIKFWDTKTGSELQTLKGHSASVTSVACSSDGQIVASGSQDCTIKLWDTKTGSELQTLKGHLASLTSVAFSSDGQTVTSGSVDCTIKLWDTKTGSELQTLKGHSDPVTSVAFSSDGQTVASGSNDCTIKLWDTKTGSELQILNGHSDSVSSVTFSSDGQTVASGSWDGTIKLWDTRTSSELQTLKAHSAWVSSVAFSSDGQTVASGSNDGTIKLWDTRTGSKLQTLKAHSDPVTSVAFSSDGQTVVSGSWDRTIKFWDTKTGSELQMLKGHSASVISVAFSSDGQIVASGSRDRIQTFSSDRHDHDSTPYNSNPQVSVANSWVSFAGETLLWLPPEHRFNCSASKDATLALGYIDGRVSIIGFHTS
ncbi:hypothetical protein EYB26_006669 [Talaromyces marneffei]|uniref:uncharacterized protein n=1 Tax=Talaromyces marneffei TaxID=37727 RepID=UPI0012AA546A|nr:uncharacterized protein EYB26_006669 [Talaromyces marneffei]QGA18984.1 hypothetical protein EYB26_006669 [Talaromyces marneffei]